MEFFYPLISVEHSLLRKLTCHVALYFLIVAERVVVLEHVQVEWHNVVAVETFPNLMVRCCPASSKDIIVPSAHVDQSTERLIQAALVANYEL